MTAHLVWRAPARTVGLHGLAAVLVLVVVWRLLVRLHVLLLVLQPITAQYPQYCDQSQASITWWCWCWSPAGLKADWWGSDWMLGTMPPCPAIPPSWPPLPSLAYLHTIIHSQWCQ